MTERVNALLTLLKSKAYKKNRISKPVGVLGASMKHNTEVFCASLDIEKPNLFPGDRIGFNRYNSESPMANGGTLRRAMISICKAALKRFETSLAPANKTSSQTLRKTPLRHSIAFATGTATPPTAT